MTDQHQDARDLLKRQIETARTDLVAASSRKQSAQNDVIEAQRRIASLQVSLDALEASAAPGPRVHIADINLTPSKTYATDDSGYIVNGE